MADETRLARPRGALDVRRYLPERPLPAYAYLPGRAPRPVAAAPEPTVPLSQHNWPVHTEYLWGVDLYNGGFAWEAHEAWEALWRVAARGTAERACLQGLIQCAAASVKSAVGHITSLTRIATRGLERLARVHDQNGAPYLGIELAGFVADFQHFVETCPQAFERRPALRLQFPVSAGSDAYGHTFP